MRASMIATLLLLSAAASATARPSDLDPKLCGTVGSGSFRAQVRVLTPGVSCQQARALHRFPTPAGWFCVKSGGSNFFPAAFGYSCSTPHKEVDFVNPPPIPRRVNIELSRTTARPTRFPVDAGATWVQDVHWSSWGGRVARGHGTSYHTVCPANRPCSEGTVRKEGTATVVLNGSFLCDTGDGGFDYYSWATVKRPGHSAQRLSGLPLECSGT